MITVGIMTTLTITIDVVITVVLTIAVTFLLSLRLQLPVATAVLAITFITLIVCAITIQILLFHLYSFCPYLTIVTSFIVTVAGHPERSNTSHMFHR